MLLPYDPTLSYWMRTLPQFEWQPEPQDPAQSPVLGSSLGACADPAASEGTPPCGDTAPQAPPEAQLPRMRLVMTGVRWIAVPYWSPRDNPYWETMAQDGRDEDTRRIDAASLQAKRRPEDVPGQVPPGENS